MQSNDFIYVGSDVISFDRLAKNKFAQGPGCRKGGGIWLC